MFLNDCSNSVRWDISPGSGSVIVSGTQLALDAGEVSGNGQPLKIWTSFPGLSQQTYVILSLHPDGFPSRGLRIDRV